MSEQTIWARLRAAGMTEAGAAGLMGNMAAESAMRANNAQDGMTSLSDEAYTSSVDKGVCEFVHDSVGYGLCQWTYYTRKAALLNYAMECGASIGDEAMQTDFAVRELRSDYAELWAYLCRTDDWYEAAERVCREYERPAVNNIDVRAAAARGYYDSFAGITCAEEAAMEKEADVPAVQWTAEMATLCQGFGGTQVLVLQALLDSWGYVVQDDAGVFGAQTSGAVKSFQADKGLVADGIVGRMTWTALLGVEGKEK